MWDFKIQRILPYFPSVTYQIHVAIITIHKRWPVLQPFIFTGCKAEQKIHFAPHTPPMSCEPNGSDLATFNVPLGSCMFQSTRRDPCPEAVISSELQICDVFEVSNSEKHQVTDKVIVILIYLVLLRLGLSEVAQNLHNRSGTTLYRYPICDTSGNTEILTTHRGRPSFVHGIKFNI